ncbi:uncharacterized protein Tco025E_04895 [Trypanosoma conorhini]|uniref:Uncharacterized protein n=1 Tax=Trypanosoma conorhini TaxID=83891 RepID=A0A422PHN0_9TRYP|nr:uncharacterized protein Tco025E_04895 [Trypanosoma conorhini]RNF17193.1 hypothetical protein Tco025E_04895 [Trypanosoma conorhini]
MLRCASRICRAASLLGYPLRRAAAMEMLYGGVCVLHLAQKPFSLRKTRSEALPSPSLQRERDDLELEVKDSTNNVMGFRLFPVNIGVRSRNEAVRLRSEDCYKRVLAQRQCAAAGEALRFPLPSSLASGERHNSTVPKQRYATHFHPPSAKLSLFTRPVDSGDCVEKTTPAEVALYHPRAWRPLQMLKPMPHNWSPTLRSSGVRGPHMQLMQERLDGKGFGWKRKSRSLWQQDINTAGFRPKRFF